MKIKVAEASGITLEWLVATAEGMTPLRRVLNRHGIQLKCGNTVCDFTTNPVKAWPIMDREKIDLIYHHTPGTVTAVIWLFGDEPRAVAMADKQALVAAMRCYAASRLGEEVEVPDEMK